MKKKRIIFGILTILWVAVIFGFSLQTGEKSGGMSLHIFMRTIGTWFPNISAEVGHLILRKCAHFTEYLILGALSFSALCHFWWSSLFCVCIAGADEILQLLVAGRYGSIYDVLIDIAGAIVGVIVIRFVIQFLKQRKKPS